MPRALYSVLLHKGQWHVDTGGTRTGPYLTRKTAIRAAVEAANRKGNSEVLVREADTQFRTVWTHGKDPYPPVQDG